MPSRRVPNFFQELIEMAKEQRSNPFMGPINLGGAGGADGGAGGPPGGFIGQLAQRHVAYDTTEAATLSTGSTPSLVDNLNHIRARLSTVEASAVPPSLTGGAEYQQTEYQVDDIDLGTTSDIVWTDVDATNAAISITPTMPGAYQVTFSFTETWNFTTPSGDIDLQTFFRLTDGVSVAGGTLSQGQGTFVGHKANVSGLFVWDDTSARTIKLQKFNVLAINVDYHIISIWPNLSVLHMDVFRLGGVSDTALADEALIRSWWAW